MKKKTNRLSGGGGPCGEALQGGQGDLAKVLYRNVFHGEGDVERSKVLERYVRREVGCLSMTDRAALLDGRIRFSGVTKP